MIQLEIRFVDLPYGGLCERHQRARDDQPTVLSHELTLIIGGPLTKQLQMAAISTMNNRIMGFKAAIGHKS